MRIITILIVMLILISGCKIQQLAPALPEEPQANAISPKSPEVPAGQASGSGGSEAVAAKPIPNVKTALIEIGYQSVNPQELRIEAGTVVVWKNVDDILPVHNIIGIEVRFQSGKIFYMSNFSHKFANKGTYHFVDLSYKETDREKYRGTIIVS